MPSPTSPRPDLPRWTLWLVLGLAAFFLVPTFRFGYLCDDAINSLLPGMLKVEGYSFLEYMSLVIRHSFRGARVYPLQIVQMDLWFYGIGDQRIHKALVIAGVVIDLALFYLLVRRVGRDAGFAVFATCLVVPLFQFRTTFDPITAFFGLFQLIVAGLLGSLLALQVYLDSGKVRWLVLGCLVYLATALFYELSFPLFTLHLVLVAYSGRGWGDRVRAALPFVAVGVLGFLTTAVLRRVFINESATPAILAATRVNFDPLAVLTALGVQVTSALPLNYFLVNRAGLFPSIWQVGALFRFAATGATAVVFTGTLVACLACLRQFPSGPDDRTPARRAPLIWLGVLLGLLPAVLISISVRHQGVLKMGEGYTPVYLQYYGVGLLLATGVWSMLPSASGPVGRRARLATALVVAGVAGLTYRANAVLVSRIEQPIRSADFNPVVGNLSACWNQERRNLERALRAGLVDNVPEHAMVSLGNEYPQWYTQVHSPYFFATYGSKVLRTTPVTCFFGPGGGWFAHRGLKRPPDPAWALAPSYYVWDVSRGRNAGFVVLTQETPSRGEGASRYGEVRVFVQHPTVFRDPRFPGFFLSAMTLPSEANPGRHRVRIRGVDLTTIGGGRGWGLFSFTAPEGGIDPRSVEILFREPSKPGAADSPALVASKAPPAPTSARR